MDLRKAVEAKYSMEVDELTAADPRQTVASEDRSVPQHWRDSETVVALSKYLKQCPGFHLVELNGYPSLHFEPGVTPSEPERWVAALEANQLLEAARDDLLYLHNHGALRLTAHPGFTR